MIQFVTILCLCTAGSGICSLVSAALGAIARRTQSDRLTAGSDGDASSVQGIDTDPVVTFGFVLICYGALALALVDALPGPRALERTALAFGLLCVGGLISEISTTGSTADLPHLDADSKPIGERRPISMGLSIALALVLNSAVAIMSFSQELIEVIPPAVHGESQPAAALDPVIVIGHSPG